MSNLSGNMDSVVPPPQQFNHTPTPPNPSPLSISTRQALSHKSPRVSYSPAPFARQLSKDPLLQHPRPTHPVIWCSAIICLVFCLLLIFFGIATLIVFLVIKPKYPSFDITNASLNAIYFDSPRRGALLWRSADSNSSSGTLQSEAGGSTVGSDALDIEFGLSSTISCY